MHRFHRVFAVFGLLLLVASPGAAATRQDEQVWINATLFGGFGRKGVFFLEAQPRIGDGVGRLNMLLLRAAVGIKLSPSVTIHQGYAHVVTPVEGGKDRNEERSFQQLGWTINRHLTSRTRFEQRWRADGGDVGFRLRQMVRAALPLHPGKRGVAALLQAEAFVALNDTDWGARAGFDQLRSFAGLELPITGKSTIEVGYQNQVINDPAGARRMNHIALLNLFLRP